MHLLTLAASAALLATPTWSWGIEGHKITAAIAQIHLLPSTRQAICSILPSEYGCNLANVATWPDEVRKTEEWKWSDKLHFVNDKDDRPPEHCNFGTKNWITDQNILNGIMNMTQNVKSKHGPEQDNALRFLTHFLGDVHQPLHLTGQYYGGNLVPVLFDGKKTSLHKAWDDDLIPERMRLLKNYKKCLPIDPNPATLIRNIQIESALDGSEYDPLVRWIVLEGIDGWWTGERREWTTCPQSTKGDKAGQQVMGLEKLPFTDPTGLPVCPYHWAAASHQLLCALVWRQDFIGVKDPKTAIYKLELNTPEYLGRIFDGKMVEKQLALGGIRLAGVLNAVLGSEKEKQSFAALPGVY